MMMAAQQRGRERQEGLGHMVAYTENSDPKITVYVFGFTGFDNFAEIFAAR